jgi:hypothetical protein
MDDWGFKALWNILILEMGERLPQKITKDEINDHSQD